MKNFGAGYRGAVKRWRQFVDFMREKGNLPRFCEYVDDRGVVRQGDFLVAAQCADEEVMEAVYVVMFMVWLVDYCGLAAITAAQYRFGASYHHCCRRGTQLVTNSRYVKLAVKGLSNVDTRARHPRLPITAPLSLKLARTDDGARHTAWWFVPAQAWAFNTWGRVSEYTWTRKGYDSARRTNKSGIHPTHEEVLRAERIAGKSGGARSRVEIAQLKRYEEYADSPRASDVIFVWLGAAGAPDIRLKASDPAIADQSLVPDHAVYNLRREKTRDRADDSRIIQIQAVCDSGVDPLLCGVKTMFEYQCSRHRRGAATSGEFRSWAPLTSDSPLFTTEKQNGRSPLTSKNMRAELKCRLNEAGEATEAVDENGKRYNRYRTHSYRHGAATQAAAAGFSLEKIKEWGRWKSDAALLYLHIALRPNNQAAVAMMGAAPDLLRSLFA